MINLNKSQKIEVYVKILFFLVGMSSQAAFSSQAVPCWRQPLFVPSVIHAQALKHWQEFLASKNYDPALLARTLVDPEDTKYIMSMYQADINNDQKLADVFVFGPYGSGAYTNVQVVQEEGGGFNYQGSVPSPKGDNAEGPWYDFPYRDPLTHKDEFLTTLCGKTYMVFDNNHFPDAYLWQHNSTYSACDADWLQYQRSNILNLEQQRLYTQAFANLNFIVDKCHANKARAIYLELQNDLAWSAYKNGNFSACLDNINLIYANPAFTNMPEKFKNAVSLNSERCNKANAKPIQLDQAWGAQEYAWLLAPNAFSQTEILKNNAKWQQLFAQTAPSKAANVLMTSYGPDAPLLSTLIYNSTVGVTFPP